MAEQKAQTTYKLSLNGAGVSIDVEVDQHRALEIVALVMTGSRAAASASAFPGAAPPPAADASPSPPPAKPRGLRGSRSSAKPTPPTKKVDISLRPDGKVSFMDFQDAKKPKTHSEKQVVAVAYLTDVLGISPIAVAHVDACYRGAEWRRPTDLANSLQKTSSEKGWLNTSDSENITLMAAGEDYVKHDLPKSKG